MILGALERFGGYTLATLLAEDCELMQLVQIEHAGSKRREDDVQHH